MDKPALWQPSLEQIEQANMTRFIGWVNQRFGLSAVDYTDLYQWSIDHYPEFWSAVWYFCQIQYSVPYNRVVANATDIINARWFPGAELNFAQNLLRFQDERTALISCNEQGIQRKVSYAQLYQEVAALARGLRKMGIKPGDRVAGYMSNTIETVAAMLAVTSLGAIWSACSPDFGWSGAADRLGQIEPRVLFASASYQYNGKIYDCLTRIEQIGQAIPSIEIMVIAAGPAPIPEALPPDAVWYQDFIGAVSNETTLEFRQFPFEHPVYIMYSSGTTGKPKCMVHGAGGTLIQHLKELILHTDLKRDDTIFYFTTCGWMMWNWLVSSLAVGAAVVLYDGSPFYPEPQALIELADELGITIFGTSARYLASLEKAGVKPKLTHNLSRLRAILSTGSPLLKENFAYVYQDIKSDVQLASISGGTDIISCFALGNPIGPVYAGELQCRGLGMKVEVYNHQGNSVINTKGELVCTAPFPSRPVEFWDDADGCKYRKAYFHFYPEVWHHGDFIEITDTGGVIIYGRSDATLNPGGVRIGTAEIYRQVETIPEVLDSLVIGQRWQGDERIILFVVLAAGMELTDTLQVKIRKVIRENTSVRHVPAKILAVADIPYTINGKKVELAVRNILHGDPVVNSEALTNPESLEYYRELPELQI
ncbi:MAG: acetoacetate--CoA ligase [Methylocystaceae bacterium]